jgi:hypothetical protein
MADADKIKTVFFDVWGNVFTDPTVVKTEFGGF